MMHTVLASLSGVLITLMISVNNRLSEEPGYPAASAARAVPEAGPLLALKEGLALDSRLSRRYAAAC